VKHDPRIVAALKKRGITDLNLVTCYATPGGYIGLPEQDGRRIGWGGCLYGVDNYNGYEDREVGGMFFTVDMSTKKLTRFTDYGITPMAPLSLIYDADGGPRAPDRSWFRSPAAPASPSKTVGSPGRIGSFASASIHARGRSSTWLR
jgi:primary-amine oxidase